MTVFIVVYFYPGGDYAGTFGVYDSEAKAKAAIAIARQDYGDCAFIITSGDVQ